MPYIDLTEIETLEEKWEREREDDEETFCYQDDQDLSMRLHKEIGEIRFYPE